MSVTLELLRQRIADKLAEIADILPDDYRMTLLARFVGKDLVDAEICVSDDHDLNAVILAIKKLKDPEPTR